MPRVTRKALVESPAAPRASPRASTKASTTSSRASDSTTPTRSSRGRTVKNEVEEEVEAEPVETKTTPRGRRQKPAGDGKAEETDKPVSRSRGRAAAKPTPEPKGRSRSRAQQAEAEVEEEEPKTKGRSRSRAKPEAKAESGRGSRGKGKGKQAKVAAAEEEEEEAEEEAEEEEEEDEAEEKEEPAKPTGRGRRGAKVAETPEADDTASRGRGRSRTKADAKKAPDVEQESPKGKKGGRGKKAPSPAGSVGSSRSSSRSRASKAQSEDVTEPAAEAVADEEMAEPKGRAASKRRSKGAEETPAESTPTGRRTGRGKKVEESPVTPTKKRRSRGKAETEEVDKEEETKDEENVSKEETKTDEEAEKMEEAAPESVSDRPEEAKIEEKQEVISEPVVENKADTPAESPVAMDKAPSVEESNAPEVTPKVDAVSEAEVKAPQVEVNSGDLEQNGESMETDELDKVDSRSQSQKRKLDDDSFEESSSKRVCVDNGEEPEAPVKAPAAVEAQMPGIEAISDVSSAEEEAPVPAPVPAPAPAAAPPSQESWQMSSAEETPAPELPKESSLPKVAASPVPELPSIPNAEATPVPKLPKEPSLPQGEATSVAPVETSVPVVRQESPVKAPEQEPPKSEQSEDLTSEYVVVNMEDVPPSDSLVVKEALPVQQNHTNQIQNTEEKAMEVEGQNGSIAPINSVQPQAPAVQEIKKQEPVIPKPVHIEPSPDIFHRSIMHNPVIDKNTVPASHMFNVVSYNILAECARKRGDYSYTDEQYLVQNYRHDLLFKELTFLDGDIMCLQEVNPAYYNNLLRPAMEKCGYQGTFIRRTWEMSDEGEATFFKNNRFALESNKGLSLAELSRKNISESGLSPEVQKAVEEYLKRADVVNISRLRCRQTNKTLTIGNIHVVWDQLKSPDVQSIQIASAVKELVAQAGSDLCPHILCGDFNSVPTSVGYQLAQDGYLSDSNIASLQAVENLKLDTGSKALVNHLWGAFQHTSSNLKSAYHTCQGEEPEVTTYTCHMLECVDYLFYGTASLGVSNILRVVDRNVIEDTNGLPNKDFPSDHLSLKASFFFK